MKKFWQVWVLGVLLALLGLAMYLATGLETRKQAGKATARGPRAGQERAHLDHAAFFPQAFSRPQEVTLACLKCHPQAGPDMQKTPHWLWLGQSVVIPGRSQPTRIGKKNLINNYCIGIQGNWAGCTKCHAGYGWMDETFDFTRAENIDCLVCHERSGAYQKGPGGVPPAETDLLAVARSVGFPRRDNCGGCHNFGGGGLGVKHGDLDSTLDNPSDYDDVHMGKHAFLCIDCHKAPGHLIRGRAYSVSVEHQHGLSCAECHPGQLHRDARLDGHLQAVACQACHIPTFSRRVATKTDWDWSKAGDPKRKDDPHTYLKIKGEFAYGHDLVPEYHWFNLTMTRYLLGDRIDPRTVTDINRPLGAREDRSARIWPFKVNRGKQPYDQKNLTLMVPVTSGKGGYWTEFDWNQAVRLGAEKTGTDYSGEVGFASTRMFWPLSHQVVPKEQALGCTDCHGEKGRLDWSALGYDGDPARLGGRR